ncbi:TDT family transporter [Aerococcus sp. UMB7834]|uniref:TDT family transporter n=1 Tax=Aerococcus sp. UMB7834 TaxID=3046342 RepID=UPI00254F6715|nr:TDT family transporter [Aerococcus sp. UMB7834]MDK6805828.1 TDT family transporter [Aerococcus sp. UMB7834]
MNYLKRQPFAMSGLILALATLGNLLQSYGAGIRLVLGGLALLLFMAYTLNLFVNYSAFKEEMSAPLPASVFPTYPMSIMLLSTYLTPLLKLPITLAEVIWYVGLIFNLVLVIRYLARYLPQRKMNVVFPSWGVVFVGFVVASVTAPVYDNFFLGQILFWFGLIGGIAVMPFMLYRVYGLRDLPQPAQLTTAILCAPFSLLVAGYVNSFQEPSHLLLAILLVFSQLLYFSILVQLPRLIRLGFFPTSAALTFPLVISALSLKLALPVLGWNNALTSLLVLLETVVAIAIVAYVLYGYMRLIFKSE